MLFFFFPRFCPSLSPFCTVCALSQGPPVSAVLILRLLQKSPGLSHTRAAGGRPITDSWKALSFMVFFRALLDRLCSLFGKWGKSEGGGLIY